MLLIIGGGVDIAGWIDDSLDRSRGGLQRRVRARLTHQEGDCFAGVDRRLADAAQREPDFCASVLDIQRHDRRHAGNGKVAAAARHLHEAGAAPRLRLRIFDVDQHLVGCDIGGEQALEETPRPLPPARRGRFEPHPRLHGDGERRKL